MIPMRNSTPMVVLMIQTKISHILYMMLTAMEILILAETQVAWEPALPKISTFLILSIWMEMAFLPTPVLRPI